MLAKNKKRGQSTAEYAILIGVVISAVIAMQMFVGGRLKAKIGDSLNYEDSDMPTGIFVSNTFIPPEGTGSYTITNRTSPIRETYTEGGKQARSIEGTEIINRTGNQTYYSQ